MFKLKKEADAKASAWSAMPRRFWALHYFCNPLSNGLCAPVFDKISILTASDDLHTLQLRHTPMQTEDYRAVLDKVTVVRHSDCDEDEDAMPFDEVLLDVDSDDPTEMLAESEPADEDADNETTQGEASQDEDASDSGCPALSIVGMLEFAKNEPELAKIRK
ncbi:hypothetical protein PI126_g12949 [Phytophthora idaei]|nr:hypothetical protein PI126_g12949 [Phytophthora idaei]